MRVMVTGATAAFGRALVGALLDDPAIDHVLAVAAHTEGHSDTARVTHRAVDLTHEREVHDLVFGEARRLGIRAVVHDALHLRAHDRGRRVHAQNVDALRHLLAACARQPAIERLVVRSAAAVYAVRSSEPNLLDEDAALDLAPEAPQWVRDRVEMDLIACAHGAVTLRCAEILAPGTGSQLWDYLQTRVCLRPLGFDPMINVLSLDDAVRAFRLALAADARGPFNVPGADTLPLSHLIQHAGRTEIPVPGPLLQPLYQLRTWAIGLDFRYDQNLRRFHFGGVLDGRRAAAELGYRPSRPLDWPGECNGTRSCGSPRLSSWL